jgi:hypothetical protein
MAQEWNSPSGTPTSVPNYLVPAIISLLCCWPLAIVAIIFAAQVNGKVAAGDIQGAMDASKKAKLFSFIAIGIGIVIGIVYAILFALGMAGGMMGNS